MSRMNHAIINGMDFFYNDKTKKVHKMVDGKIQEEEYTKEMEERDLEDLLGGKIK